MTDLEGAVERVKAIIEDRNDSRLNFSERVALRTILDALASITRERDAMREGLAGYLDAQRSYDAIRLTTVGDAVEDARERVSEAEMLAAALVNGEGE